MLRRTLLTAAALLVPAGFLVVSAPQAAWALPNAHGTVRCPVTSGSGTVHPGLSVVGSHGGVKITFKATLGVPGALLCGGAVTSPPGDKIVGGTLTGSGYYNAPTSAANGSSCANFDGPDKLGVITEVIKWNVIGPPIANTKVVYKNNAGTVSGATVDTIDLNVPPAGTAVKAGSFAFPPAGNPRVTQLVTTLPAPGAGCPTVPQVNFTITGGVVAM